MRKLILFTMVLLICGGMLFAGGGRQGSSEATGQTTIRWAFWGNETRIQLTQQAIEEFMRLNPSIKVNIEPTGGTVDMFTRVDTQLAGGAGPDIIQMGTNFPDYVNRNVILELEPLGSSGRGLINTSVIDQSALEAATLNGHLWGISTGANYEAFLVNKTMLEKAGAPLPKMAHTWEEFRAYLMQIKPLLPAGVYPIGDLGWTGGGARLFEYWARWYGQTPYVRSTNSTELTPEACRIYLEMWQDYRNNGLIPPPEVAAAYPNTGPDHTSDFVVGKAAITLLTSNMLSSYMGVMEDELMLIQMPGINAATKPLETRLSQVMTINRASRNIDDAAKLIDFMTNSPIPARLLGSNRGSPNSSTYRAAMPSNPIDDVINAYIGVVAPFSTKERDLVPNDAERSSTGYLIYQGVYFGDLTPAQGGREIYDMYVRLINK